jgi:hypothetical protein
VGLGGVGLGWVAMDAFMVWQIFSTISRNLIDFDSIHSTASNILTNQR